MINIQIINQVELIAFWLIFSRWLTILFQLPIFDTFYVPNLLKILVSIIISYAFYTDLYPEVLKDIQYYGINNFWFLTISYTFIGLLIGYVLKSIMAIFLSAGAIINQQIGFASISYFDPNAQQQVGAFERLIQWTMVAIIITSGALIPMFKGGIESFSSIHIYDLGKISSSPIFFVDFFKSIFLAGILLASPLIFINLLMMSILGIISKVVPQLNIIMISFVTNIGLGLIVFWASSDEFFRVGFKIYTEKLTQWFQFVT